jgi:hypothetical protein
MLAEVLDARRPRYSQLLFDGDGFATRTWFEVDRHGGCPLKIVRPIHEKTARNAFFPLWL